MISFCNFLFNDRVRMSTPLTQSHINLVERFPLCSENRNS